MSAWPRPLSRVVARIFAAFVACAACHAQPLRATAAPPNGGAARDVAPGAVPQSLAQERPRAEATLAAIDAEYQDRLAERLRAGGPYEQSLVLDRMTRVGAPASALPTLLALLEAEAPIPDAGCLSMLAVPRESILGQGEDWYWAQCMRQQSTGVTSNAFRARKVLGNAGQSPELGPLIVRRAVERPPSERALAVLLREGRVGGIVSPAIQALGEPHAPESDAALLELLLAAGVHDTGDLFARAASRLASSQAAVRRRAALVVLALSPGAPPSHVPGAPEDLARALGLLEAELRDRATTGVAAEVARARIDSQAIARLVPALVDRLKTDPADTHDVLAALAASLASAAPALPALLQRLARPEPDPFLEDVCRTIGAIGGGAREAKPLLLRKLATAGWGLPAVLDALDGIRAPLRAAEWSAVRAVYAHDCKGADSVAFFDLTRDEVCSRAATSLESIAHENHVFFDPKVPGAVE